MFSYFKKYFQKKKSEHCECEIDCGAHIYYTTTSIGKKWCPTVMNRLIAPFKQYPWNQVGINNQVLQTNEDMKSWKLIRNKEILDEGDF